MDLNDGWENRQEHEILTRTGHGELTRFFSCSLETEEKLDTKMALTYFSRARFVQNLLPTLSSTAATSSFGARVISVLSPGREGQINFDDMELRNTFSLRNAESHAVSFNSASFQYLGSKYPEISFIHSYPGGVATPMFDNAKLHPVISMVAKVSMKVLGGLLTSPEESGERHLWLSTDEKFKKGAWLVDNKGEESAGSKAAESKGIIGVGVGERVWHYVEEMFKKIEDDGKAY